MRGAYWPDISAAQDSSTTFNDQADARPAVQTLFVPDEVAPSRPPARLSFVRFND